MKNDIADILFKYTTGEATLEETNDALKEAEAGFNLEPGRNEITPDEMALTTVGDTPDSGEGHLVGGNLVAARFQAETRLRLLQGVVRLFQGGLAGGVLEQDVCDVVLHGVVLLLKNASAVHFCSTAPPFPLSFFLGV